MIAGAVASAAPLLGSLLGGPVGAGVTAAAALVAHALGTPPGDAAAAAAALASDPDAALKLARVESAERLQLARLAAAQEEHRLASETHELEIAAQDRDSARRREEAVRDSTTRVLAYAIVGGFLAMCGAVLLGWAKVDSVMVGTLVGYLSAKAEQVASYYFGSSASSRAKDSAIADLAKP